VHADRGHYGIRLQKSGCHYKKLFIASPHLPIEINIKMNEKYQFLTVWDLTSEKLLNRRLFSRRE
jgi:hypothetical protein